MKNDAKLAKATDWVTEIAPFCWLLFGCSEEIKGCGMYPTKSGNFYRMSNLDNERGSEEGGFWACGYGPCMKRWSWGKDGKYQLMIVGDPDNLDANMCSYMGLGYKDKQIMQELAVLKGSAVLEVIGKQTVTTKTILRALEVLAARAEKKLMKRFPTVVVEAGDVEKKYGTRLFCENPILSIANKGKTYRCIKVEKGAIPELTVNELRSIIDTCAAFMDIEHAVGKGKAFKKAVKNLTERMKAAHVQDIVSVALQDQLGKEWEVLK